MAKNKFHCLLRWLLSPSKVQIHCLSHPTRKRRRLFTPTSRDDLLQPSISYSASACAPFSVILNISCSLVAYLVTQWTCGEFISAPTRLKSKITHEPQLMELHIDPIYAYELRFVCGSIPIHLVILFKFCIETLWYTGQYIRTKIHALYNDIFCDNFLPQ